MKCIDCKQEFTPGSVNQKRCKKCSELYVQKLNERLKELTAKKMGTWNGLLTNYKGGK